MPRSGAHSAHRRHGKTIMGYGEFTRARAAGRAAASAAGGAAETERGWRALRRCGTSPQATRPGRRSSLTPIPARGDAGTNAPAAQARPKAQGQARSQTESSMASPECASAVRALADLRAGPRRRGQKRTPANDRGSVNLKYLLYQALRRRLISARPPMPSRAIVAGSGVKLMSS
jgi:hypothetical protein